MYTIKFSNGLRIKNLELNGNNIVSPTKIDESTFADGLEIVKITGDSQGDEELVYNNAVLAQQIQYEDGKWYLVFREKTPQELLSDRLHNLISTNTDGITSNATDITDLQIAIADIYELLISTTSSN